MPIKTFTDLDVYNLSHELAMDIFNISKRFPSEEKYSLTDQVRRSSRSVAVNVAEGWGKRIYPANFIIIKTEAIGGKIWRLHDNWK
jgi:four helix bundle protein